MCCELSISAVNTLHINAYISAMNSFRILNDAGDHLLKIISSLCF